MKKNTIMKEKDESIPFIDINLSDQLANYRNFIDLINSIANDSKFVRLLPVLNRNLLENLLRDIFISSLIGEYNFLYFNQSRGCIRNFSTLLNLFSKLRRNFRESYALNIPDEIIGYLDKFRKDGNYNSHEIETYIKTNYINDIKDDFTATIRVLVQLYQKIINSKKKIEKIDEKILKGHGKTLKNTDISKIVRLIASIRNEIANINHHETENQNSITINQKKKIQEIIDEFHVSISKINLSIDSLLGIIKNLGKLEIVLNSKNPDKQSLKNYLEMISMYFKANLIILSKNDITMVKQMIKIKNQKKLIIGITISFFFIFLILIL